jgi:hypothetical protein
LLLYISCSTNFSYYYKMEPSNFTTKTCEYANKICSACLVVCERYYWPKLDMKSLSEKQRIKELNRPCEYCKCEEYRHQCGSYEFVWIDSISKNQKGTSALESLRTCSTEESEIQVQETIGTKEKPKKLSKRKRFSIKTDTKVLKKFSRLLY